MHFNNIESIDEWISSSAANWIEYFGWLLVYVCACACVCVCVCVCVYVCVSVVFLFLAQQIGRCLTALTRPFPPAASSDTVHYWGSEAAQQAHESPRPDVKHKVLTFRSARPDFAFARFYY